jgi:hypothetical protein
MAMHIASSDRFYKKVVYSLSLYLFEMTKKPYKLIALIYATLPEGYWRNVEDLILFSRPIALAYI